MTASSSRKTDSRFPARFTVFKYVLYGLLLVNTLYFLAEDYTAAGYTFRNGITLGDMAEIFATFIDSISWFVLLIVFELETSILSDARLKGTLKWGLSGIVAVAYAFTLLAWTGYAGNYRMMQGFQPVQTTSLPQNPCEYTDGAPDGQNWALANDLDRYEPLDPVNCRRLAPGDFSVHPDIHILADTGLAARMRRLSLTDVVNAGAWLLIVLILQADVLLHLSGALTQPLIWISIGLKAVLYAVIVLACFYWALLAAWVDFWDAFLWLLAFFCIELNLFSWNRATARAAP